jgi:hypothetical protein
MPNEEHLSILMQGIAAWNHWRQDNPHLRPDLAGAMLYKIKLPDANLAGVCLSNAVLRKANLQSASLQESEIRGADFSGAFLIGANLSRSDLTDSFFSGAYLQGAQLSGANLDNANLSRTDLRKANFMEANLNEANLKFASLIETNFERANLSKCFIYGASVWGVKLKEAKQRDLILTRNNEPTIMVDNLEVAQFIYLLLNNEKIRDVINTVGKKGVLILGRFTPDRKAVLNAIREELRRLGYVPMLFDFEKPTDKDFTETIMTLAGLSLFIIADITNPKSSPLELQATVPNYMTPFVPIIEEGEVPFSMFKDLQGKFDWILDTLIYDSEANLIRGFEKAILDPALKKHDELMIRKAQNLQTRHIGQYLKDS